MFPQHQGESLMTDTPGGTPPFGSFSGMTGFSQGDMMEKMWDMMKLNPFAAAAGGSPSLSMMSDMMAPLTNVEELDKRITDMRAVEQWLKLNLNMLQSAIQALEVQRATLATLRAFGAFAQASMSRPAAEPASTPSWMHPPAASPASAAAQNRAPETETSAADETGEASAAPAFDTSAWWNLLPAQFNQPAH